MNVSLAADKTDPSILIVLTGALGDIARGVSLLAPLRERYPEAVITWLVENKWRPVIECQRCVDDIIEFDRSRGIRAFLDVRNELRCRSFDITLDLQRHLKSGILSILSGAKRRIGFHPRNAKEFNWLFNNRYIRYSDESLTKILHYRFFLEQLGIEDTQTPVFSTVDPGKYSELPSNPVVIVLGSSWESKDWFLTGYRELLQFLFEDSEEAAVLVGDGKQVSNADLLATEFSEELNAGRLINTVGKTSLAELLQIINSARLCIGPDSGPGHLAAMFNVSAVTLFGPTAPERVAPFGSEHLAVVGAAGCAPCKLRRCPGLDQLCMRTISAAQVMEKVALAGRDGG